MASAPPKPVDRRKAALERRRQQMQAATAALEQTVATTLKPGLSMAPSMRSEEGSVLVTTESFVGEERRTRASRSPSMSMYAPVKLPSQRKQSSDGTKKEEGGEETKKEEGGDEIKTEADRAVVPMQSEKPPTVSVPVVSVEESKETSVSPPVVFPPKKEVVLQTGGQMIVPPETSDRQESHLEAIKKAPLVPEKSLPELQNISLTAVLPQQINHKLEESSSHFKEEVSVATSVAPPLSPPTKLQTVPSLITEAAPSLLKEAAPSLLKEAAPSLLKEAAPSLLKEAAPSLLKEAVPSLTKEAAQAALTQAVARVVSEEMLKYADVIAKPFSEVPSPFDSPTLASAFPPVLGSKTGLNYSVEFRHKPKKPKPPAKEKFVPPPSYSEEQQHAIISIQAWWRGHITRTWLSAALITRRLHSGGPSVKDTGKSRTRSLWTKSIERNSSTHSPLPEATELRPWSRSLVKSLCQFLDCVESSSDELQPSDLPIFGGDCDTMTRVYRRQESVFAKQRAFSFTVEKRALRQLKESREAREALMQRLKNKEVKM